MSLLVMIQNESETTLRFMDCFNQVAFTVFSLCLYASIYSHEAYSQTRMQVTVWAKHSWESR
jgi:hypothetical protein